MAGAIGDAAVKVVVIAVKVVVMGDAGAPCAGDTTLNGTASSDEWRA
jgi:hypothetical protein